MSDPDLLSPALKALSSVLLGVAEPAEVLGQILDAARVQTEADRSREITQEQRDLKPLRTR